MAYNFTFLLKSSAAFTMLLSLACAEVPEAPTVLLGGSDNLSANAGTDASTNTCQDIEIAASRLQEVSSLLYKFCVEDLKSDMDQPERIYGLSNPQAQLSSKAIQNPADVSQSSLESYYTIDVDTSVDKVFAMKYLEASDIDSFVARGFAKNSSEVSSAISETNNGNNERNQHVQTSKTVGSVEISYESGRRFLKVDENNYVVFSESITTKPTEGVLYLKDLQIISRLSSQRSRIYSLSSQIVNTSENPNLLSLLQNEVRSERLRLFQNTQHAANAL